MNLVTRPGTGAGSGEGIEGSVGGKVGKTRAQAVATPLPGPPVGRVKGWLTKLVAASPTETLGSALRLTHLREAGCRDQVFTSPSLKSDQCLSSPQRAAGHRPFLVLDPAPWNDPLALGTGPSAQPWEPAITHHSLSQDQMLNRTLVCESGARPQREETLFCARFCPSGFSVHWLL